VSQAEDTRTAEETPPSLRADTWADRTVRFGCGAVLALLMIGVVVVTADGASPAAIAVVALVAIAVCGTLAVMRGEKFVHAVLRVFTWL
jgi:hypothetical protein